MLATVTYPYRDRETFAVHLPGDEVELTEARFAELSAGGYVDAAEEPANEAEDAVDDAVDEFAEPLDADDCDMAPNGVATPVPAPVEPTCAQIRAQIEAKGGFAPKKATKDQLAGILESL